MIEGIYIYPVKGTRRVPVQRACVARRGLENDRLWMLADQQGRFLSQRGHASLALVQAHLVPNGLRVEAPAMPTLWVPVPEKSAVRVPVRIWKDDVEAYGAGEEANDWFSRYLNMRCSLVYMADNVVRKVDPMYDPGGAEVSFADGYPLLLTSVASLDALNTRLSHPVPMTMTRFRPNLVVTGGEAFAEDAWSKVRIGSMLFHVVKPCTRCVVTTIDQDTAEQGKEPLRTLQKFRRWEGKVYFGENLIPEAPGEVCVGDPVKILTFRRRFFSFQA